MYALKGGAKKVVSVDISAPAIAECTENVVLNSLENHEGVVADCFDYLRKMPTDYFDMIVLDPPAFAKHSKAVDKAAQGYKDINLQAFKAIKKGGLVFTFSCSQNISTDLFQKIVFAAAADSGRNVQIIKRLEQGEDHPINIYHPEGDYLKGLMVKVD